MGLAADHLVGLENRHDLLDSAEALEAVGESGFLGFLRSDGANDRALGAAGDVRAEAPLLEPRDDRLYVLLGGGRTHDDDHWAAP